jgi:molybdate transport system regulatory protein
VSVAASDGAHEGSTRRSSVRISARNQLPATVTEVSEGQVMAEVSVTVDGGHEMVAAITAESARRLGLVPGKKVTVIVKSTDVLLATGD